MAQLLRQKFVTFLGFLNQINCGIASGCQVVGKVSLCHSNHHLLLPYHHHSVMATCPIVACSSPQVLLSDPIFTFSLPCHSFSAKVSKCPASEVQHAGLTISHHHVRRATALQTTEALKIQVIKGLNHVLWILKINFESSLLTKEYKMMNSKLNMKQTSSSGCSKSQQYRFSQPLESTIPIGFFCIESPSLIHPPTAYVGHLQLHFLIGQKQSKIYTKNVEDIVFITHWLIPEYICVCMCIRVFLAGSDGKASACNVGNPGTIPGLGSSMEKEMATHSNTLAQKMPWMKEPCRLQSIGSQRVGHY